MYCGIMSGNGDKRRVGAEISAAYLEREQRLVDLSAFDAPVAVDTVQRICPAFGSRQIDEREAAQLVALLGGTVASYASNRELQNCM